VKLIVGGAPVTEGFAQKIGADGYASDAGKAVTLAKSLILS
jgi:5-methyltetrahydrofolate--homocysteine methyltransferase